MAANKSKKPWVDGPYRLVETPAKRYGVKDKSTHAANEMAILHNTYLRSLNSIYLQCKGLSPSTHREDDISDFLFYCQTWANHLQAHHDTEEDLLFPAIESLAGQKGLLDNDRNQHEAFSEGFHEFKKYVEAVRPDKYDGSKIQQLIKSFGGPLEEHMHDEIDSLMDIGKKYDPDGAKISKLMHEIGEKIRAKSSMSTDGPFVFSSQDRTYEGGIQKWPTVPFFVPYVVSFVGSHTEHAGSWRFAGSDFFGQPRELMFLPAEDQA